jgi:hypothetical protein
MMSFSARNDELRPTLTDETASQRFSQATPSLSRSSPRLYLMAVR